MSASYAVSALEVKRSGGSLTRVSSLTEASLEVKPRVIEGAISSGWGTRAPSTVGWVLSFQAKPAGADAGLAAALAACRSGEVVEIEAILGEGRRISASAIVERVGRGGDVKSAFEVNLAFLGSGKLCGLYESSYPSAPANLAVDSIDAGAVTFSWDEVANVDGYYIYWGTRDGGGYPFWRKIDVDDLSDSANPSWTLYGLPVRLLYLVVTSYTQSGTCVLESGYSDEVSVTPLAAEGDLYITFVASNLVRTLEHDFEDGTTALTTYTDEPGGGFVGISIDQATGDKYVAIPSDDKIIKLAGEIGSVTASDWITSEDVARYVRISGSNVWWVQEKTAGLVRKAPISTPGSASTVITMAAGHVPRNFALSDTYIFLASQRSDQYVHRYLLDGSDETEVFEGLSSEGAGIIRAVAVDEANGYVYWGMSISHTLTVYRRKTDLSTAAEVFATLATGGTVVNDIQAPAEFGEVYVLGVDTSGGESAIEVYDLNGNLLRKTALLGGFSHFDILIH